jgi:hypothetical protein
VSEALKNAAVFLAVVRRNTTLSTVTFRSHKAINGRGCKKKILKDNVTYGSLKGTVERDGPGRN